MHGDRPTSSGMQPEPDGCAAHRHARSAAATATPSARTAAAQDADPIGFRLTGETSVPMHIIRSFFVIYSNNLVGDR